MRRNTRHHLASRRLASAAACVALTVTLLFACRSSEQPVATGAKKTTSSSKEANSTETPGAEGAGAAAVSGIQGGQCTIDQLKVACSLPVDPKAKDRFGNPNNNIWGSAGDWPKVTGLFSDKTAHWISILPDYSHKGTRACKGAIAQALFMYVSHFVLTQPEDLIVEQLADSAGEVYIWRDGLSSQLVLSMKTGEPDNYAKKSVTLQPGEYVVGVIGGDSANPEHPESMVITATAVSIFSKTSNMVVLHTDGSEKWCGYTSDGVSDLAAFFKASAGCLPCYGGH